MDLQTGSRVMSMSSGKAGEVISRYEGDDHLVVKFDDNTYGELPEELLKTIEGADQDD